MNPNDDGVSHINIYSKGRTDIGRLLSNFSHTPFIHPKYGRFSSVEGFWYWLKTGMKHEILRDLYGFEAKQVGKTFNRVEYPGFNEEVLEAIRCKLKQNRNILMMLTESALPLEHYYCFGTKVIELPQYKWIVDEFDRIRNLMKSL